MWPVRLAKILNNLLKSARVRSAPTKSLTTDGEYVFLPEMEMLNDHEAPYNILPLWMLHSYIEQSHYHIEITADTALASQRCSTYWYKNSNCAAFFLSPEKRSSFRGPLHQAINTSRQKTFSGTPAIFFQSLRQCLPIFLFSRSDSDISPCTVVTMNLKRWPSLPPAVHSVGLLGNESKRLLLH